MQGAGEMRTTNEVVALHRRDPDSDVYALQSSILCRLMLEASPDIVYVYDRMEQRYPFVSGRCKEILGYSPQQLQRLRADDVESLIHPEDLERVRLHYARQEALRDEEVAQSTYRLARRTGEYCLLRCRQKVLARGTRGEVLHILGIATDITEQANRERELAGLKEQVLLIREDEQRRLALHLHDTAVQHLVGAALLLHGFETTHRVDVDGSVGILGEVRASLSRALREIVEPLARVNATHHTSGVASSPDCRRSP